MPDWWSKVSENNEKKTRSGLLMQRKTEQMPHISYDLDGDGIVGGRDLVIGKLFDTENKGSLTIKQREAAFKAIKEDNLEHNFVWGIE